LLDGFDVELGQFVPPQRATDQKCQVSCNPACPLGSNQSGTPRSSVGDVGQAGRLLLANHVPLRRA
jgi:hypothetical protein